MNIHVFEHVPFEGLGEIEPWILARGHRLTRTQFFREDSLPDPDSVDWLIVMGGPMNVYEYRNYPWLRAETEFIGGMIRRGKRVLGICLGAQLIAEALGAKVYQNEEKEIGWLPVRLRPEGTPMFRSAGPELEVFHWHGDTFDLPLGAAWLAESEGCKRQAFSYGRRVVGLQFHLEMNSKCVATLVEHGRADLTPGRFVQGEEEILRRQSPAAMAALQGLLDAIAEP